MRIAYLDCVGGISGDMFVGALLDAGWSEASLRKTVAWLGEEIAELHIERREHHSLAGKGIRVVPIWQQEAPHAHGREHPSHTDPRVPHHRGLADVLACLDRAALLPAVREAAGRVFRRLAEAEAHAHGTTIEKMHFHEVGAVDAIVDIVATCQGLHDLEIGTLYVSPLPLGAGTIEASHGTIPIPAPATAFLVQGVPVRWAAGPGERTTPTGAALVTTLARCGLTPPDMEVQAVGTGAGTRPLSDVPNLARLFVGAPRGPAGATWSDLGGSRPSWGWGDAGERNAGSSPAGIDDCPGNWGQVVVLAAQVDDATAEEIAGWTAELQSGGALDAYLTPLIMKKGRPGLQLTVLCRPDQEPALIRWLLRETSTLGVRRHLEWRRELRRETREVITRFGSVPVKLALRDGAWIGKPEDEACRRLAQAAGVSYRAVWRAAIAALEAADGPPRAD